MEECKAMHGHTLNIGDKVYCLEGAAIVEATVRKFTYYSIILAVTYPHNWRRVINKRFSQTKIVKCNGSN